MTSSWGNSDSATAGGSHGTRLIRVAPGATDTRTWSLRACLCATAVLSGGYAAHADGGSVSTPHEEVPASASGAEHDTGHDGGTRAGVGGRRTQMTNASHQQPQRGDAASVDVVCKAAVALALAEPERARAFLARARMAGWLPEIHFRVYRRFARTEGLTFADMGTGAVAPVDISAVDDVRYEWRGSWDLSRMVFNPDELQAHFEALRMADVRRDIQSLVIKLYFERLRLLADADPADAADSDRRTGNSAPGISTDGTPSAQKLAIRVTEIEAQLDALSGGAFTRERSVRHPAAAEP